MAGLCVYRCLKKLSHYNRHILRHSEILSGRLLKQMSIKLLQSFLHTSSDSIRYAICRLESRCVIRLAGKDTGTFLQGLVTNDVYQLTESTAGAPTAMYAMVLNVQGRVLYDLFLYNVTKADKDLTVLLIDVDISVKDEIINLLKKYRLRRKVDIQDVSAQFKVWSQWNEDASRSQSDKEKIQKLMNFNDPRLPILANRIITEQDNLDNNSNLNEKDFRVHRYKNGIPEGVTDLPPGNCFPLESNLALMNGVNFQKGCYIGQELTARTFHTGVTRKRLMPIYLSSFSKVTPDTAITCKETGKSAGKVRSLEGNYGLGLLRLEYIQEELTLEAQDKQIISVKPHVPEWWPKTAIVVGGT